MSNQSWRGFSLAEVILCLGILAMAAVMAGSVFVSLFRNSNKSSHTQAGVMVAETVMNQQLHDIFLGVHPTLTKASFFAIDSPPNPPLLGKLTLSNTDYEYRMDFSTVRDTLGAPVGGGLTDNRLKAVTVTCWWWGATETSQRAGQGKLSVQVRRLVNENAQF